MVVPLAVEVAGAHAAEALGVGAAPPQRDADRILAEFERVKRLAFFSQRGEVGVEVPLPTTHRTFLVHDPDLGLMAVTPQQQVDLPLGALGS